MVFWEKLYREKGAAAVSFNCVRMMLTVPDLDRLEADIKENCLPPTEGFFYMIGAKFKLGRRSFMTDKARHYVAECEPASFKTTEHEVELAHTATVKAVQKNWKLLSTYVVITVVGCILSYFTKQWISVALSVFVAVVTFFIGRRMIREVITTTIRIR